MRRVVSLMLIAALLSVSGLPLLPAPTACAYGVELMEDCGECYEGMDHSMTMKHGTEHGTHHDNVVSDQHSKELSPAEKECRIECGCGCNASLDGLPHQLAPHSPSAADIEMLTPEYDLAATAVSVPEPYITQLPTPPPKSDFSTII